MKSSLELAKKLVTEDHYPCLYKSRSNELTVLFINCQAGTVVFKGNGIQNVGHYSVDWVNCTDSTQWERLPVGSKVVLEQE